MKIYLVYEEVSSATPGIDASCVDIHKAFTSREKAREYVEELVNDPGFKWRESVDPDPFSYVDYDIRAQKRFVNRPEYVYEEGEPKDENRLYVEIFIREVDLD